MKIAVVGATGAVGREILVDLEESSIPNIEIFAFASPRSAGEVLSFRGQAITVRAFSLEAIKDCPYVLMSAGKDFSKASAQSIAKQGAVVIDNSSAWRMDPQHLLVVPEVNGHMLKGFKQGVIANPNCSTIQMVLALAPLKQAFGLDMVQVATYQSVSGTGQKGIKQLSDELHAHFKFEEAGLKTYEHPIAFNVIPYIGAIDDTGYCEEELKMIYETRKIMESPALDILPTTARVPVFNCHSEAITVKLSRPTTRQELVQVLSTAKGLDYISDEARLEFPTALRTVGQKGVYVCRARLLLTHDNPTSLWVQFWNVADNLKKGAATNAVQILEHLIA